MKMGKYIEFSGYKEKGHRTIANLYLSFMHAAGIEAPETFGQLDGSLRHLDLTGPLEELRQASSTLFKLCICEEA